MLDGGRIYLTTPESDNPKQISSFTQGSQICLTRRLFAGIGLNKTLFQMDLKGKDGSCNTTDDVAEEVSLGADASTPPTIVSQATIKGEPIFDSSLSLMGYLYTDNLGRPATFDAEGRQLVTLNQAKATTIYAAQDFNTAKTIIQIDSNLYLVSTDALFKSNFKLPAAFFTLPPDTQLDSNGDLQIMTLPPYSYFVAGTTVYQLDSNVGEFKKYADISNLTNKVYPLIQATGTQLVFPVYKSDPGSSHAVVNRLVSVDINTGASKNFYTTSSDETINDYFTAGGSVFINVETSGGNYNALAKQTTDSTEIEKINARWQIALNNGGSEADSTKHIFLLDGGSLGKGNTEVAEYAPDKLEVEKTYGTVADDYRSVSIDDIAQHNYVFLGDKTSGHLDLYLFNMETDNSLHKVTSTPNADDRPM